MVVHEKAVGATVEWYTPRSLFDALGIDFDLDPAGSPRDYVRAREAVVDGRTGLDIEWRGRIWLNPPYGPQAVGFIERMIQHENGILLVAARTETRWFQKAAAHAHLVCFMRDRLHFINGNTGEQSRSSHASVLMAWGRDCVNALWRADLGWSPWTVRAKEASEGVFDGPEVAA